MSAVSFISNDSSNDSLNNDNDDDYSMSPFINSPFPYLTEEEHEMIYKIASSIPRPTTPMRADIINSVHHDMIYNMNI